MELDDDVCLCFHVTLRKLRNFVKVERPARASQLSDCQGAGTGCGWCRPFLERLHREGLAERRAPGGGNEPTGALPGEPLGEPGEAPPSVAEGEVVWPTAEDYSERRAAYIRAGKGTPPSGT